MIVDEILDRLENVKRQGGGWTARCPAHNDRNNSLSVNETHDRSLVKCHAGCDIDDVCAAMGLEQKDLFFEQRQREEPEAIYDYVDADGKLVLQVLRMPGKRFLQRRPAPDGEWIWKTGDITAPLYRLPEVLQAIKDGRRVHFVEGEKDADAIVAAGGVATTKRGGSSSKWEAGYTESLTGAILVVVQDKDDAGRKGARKVIRCVGDAPKQVFLAEALEGKDPYDHLHAGLTLRDFVYLPLEETEQPKPSVTNGIVLTRADAVQPRDVEWVYGFEQRIPYGGVTLLMGMPGSNKSTYSCLVASQVTREESAALFISTEDSHEMVVRPRLQAVGADLTRCHFVGVMDGGFESIVEFPKHTPDIEKAIRETGARLVVVDPIAAHFGDNDGNNDPAVRRALAPFARMIERNKVAAIIVLHLNKGRSVDPMIRAGGSIGLPGLARSGLLMGAHPSEPDNDSMRVLASWKSSWSAKPGSLVYRVEDAIVPGLEQPTIRLSPFGQTYHSAKQLLVNTTYQREDH